MRLGTVAVVFVVIMLLAVVSIKGYELQQKANEYKQRQAYLESEITKEEQRSEQIAEYKKYTETNKYIEDIAKDKLGLVYENEIVFKSDD